MGITTAAGLWTAACSGLAIGIGFYEGAVLGGIAIAFTVSGLLKFDIWLRKKSRYLDLYIEYNTKKGGFSEFLQYAKDHEIEVHNIQISRGYSWHDPDGKRRTLSYIVTVSSLPNRTHTEMIEILAHGKGVLFVEEL